MVSNLPESPVPYTIAGQARMKMIMEMVQHTTGEDRLLNRTRPDTAKRDSFLPPTTAHPFYNNGDHFGPREIATSSGSSGSHPVCHLGFGLDLAFELCHLSLDGAQHNNVDYSGPWCILHGEGAGRSWAISDTPNTCIWGGAKTDIVNVKNTTTLKGPSG